MSYTQEEVDSFPEFEDDYEDQFIQDSIEDVDYDEPTVLPTDEELQDATPSPEDTARLLESFDEVLEIDDSGEGEYYVSQWKARIILKGITKAEFDFMRKKSRNPKLKAMQDEVLTREVVMTGVVKPVIDSKQYNILQNKSAGAVIGIYNEILRRSGLADEAEKERERRFHRK